MQDIKIISLTKKMLEDALKHDLYWDKNSKVVPFSKNKAKWLLQNERIENEDICAILGYENDELISFVYMVPDYIKTDKGFEKIFWSNRWWVHEKYENSVLSTYTKKLSIEAVNKQVLIKYVGSETLEYYRKQSFKKFGKRNKYIFVFSLDYHLIINKAKFLKNLSPLLKVITKLSHVSVASINKLKISRNKRKLSYTYLDSIDDTAWAFIEKYCENDLIPKSKAYLNWQINNNQYVEIDATNTLPYKCLLSSISYKIFNSNFLVLSNSKVVGFISVLIRGDEFVLRYFLSNKENYNLCLEALMHNFIRSKCTYILTDDEVLGEHIQQRFISIYTNKKEQFSLAHNDINYNFDNMVINEQDGHFA